MKSLAHKSLTEGEDGKVQPNRQTLKKRGLGVFKERRKHHAMWHFKKRQRSSKCKQTGKRTAMFDSNEESA